ncbi:MFS transporter [Saccharopolyspora spinosa]|uniref:MFS transporter n=1 Tax=Saccharopolyspora spinosa TaxID=60894 RepID=A0A2N3Y001_SACSN|nr:MFS transporter [Saccharopolyspora spinosa]PKW16242.1 MFS transporter [Saccharopolyspora spinosa]
MTRTTPLVALVAAGGIATLGSTMTLIAIPWFVLQTTGSGVSTGLVAAAETLGLVLSVVLTGTLVDRYGARRASLVADLFTCGAVVLIPLAHNTVGVSLPLLVVLALGIGAGRAPSRSAKQVLLPAVLAVTRTRVSRGTSAEEASQRAGDLIGALLGGLLIALFSPATVLLADGAALLLAAVFVGVFVRVRPVSGGHSAAGYLQELREALGYLRRDRLLVVLGASNASSNALTTGLLSVLLPAFGVLVWHNSTLVGVLIGAASGGSMLGTALYALRGTGRHRWRTFAVCGLISGPPVYLVVALGPPPVLLVGLVSLSMVANGALNPVIAAVKYDRVPEPLRGRVFSALHAVGSAAMPLGSMIAGVLLDGIGPHGAAYALCGLCVIAVGCPFVFKVWRQMDAASRQLGSTTTS